MNLPVPAILICVVGLSVQNTSSSITGLRRDDTPIRIVGAVTATGPIYQNDKSERRQTSGEKYYVLGNKSADRDPEQAIKYYRMAIKKGVDTDNLRIELGIQLRMLRRYDEASEQFRVAIKRNGGSMRAHLGLAYTLLYSKNYEEALVEFGHVKRLDPDSYRTGLLSDYIAESLDALGRYEEALTEYQLALQCNCKEQSVNDRIAKRIGEIKGMLNRKSDKENRSR